MLSSEGSNMFFAGRGFRAISLVFVLCIFTMIRRSPGLMSRALLRSAVSCKSSRVFHASRVDSLLSEISTDALVEGAYVELKTGDFSVSLCAHSISSYA